MMKKTIFAAAAVALMLPVSFAASAQTKTTQSVIEDAAKALSQTPETVVEAPKPVYWTNSLQTSLQFSQTSLTNWSAGGVNSISLATYIVGQANYAKDKNTWSNKLQIDYGFIHQADRPFVQKNTDRIYFESKFARKATEKLNYSANFDFRSQFSNTYSYTTPTGLDYEPKKQDWMDARTLQSGFFSPAYLTLAVGIDWVPNPKNNWLVVNLSPVTGGLTVVADKKLRYSYSMERKNAYEDESAYPYEETLEDGTEVAHGEYFRAAKFQLGAQLKVDLSIKVNDNFSYTSQLVLFSDYLDNPQNLRVNFDNRINWALSKYLTLSFTSFLIYDDNVLITKDDDIDKYPDGKQRVQFKETVGLGFVYTFQGK